MSENETPSTPKKPYQKPTIERMNDPKNSNPAVGGPPAPPAAAHASPIAPGMVVF